MTTVEKLLKLTKQFYPSGRAFRVRELGELERLHEALAISEGRADDDAKAILNVIIPDNDGFTADDATQWERRLGIISNESVSLSDRKLAILRKMKHPGTTPARSNYRFLQQQLRDAGFDVYVYENRFWNGSAYVTKSPVEFSGTDNPVQYGDSQYGTFQYGGSLWDLIASSIYAEDDAVFNPGYDNLRFTFFIGGPYAGTRADVDASREYEFRQLICRAKPVNMIGYLLINYV
jgi:uncharacterized protein YmfQ (DUF2313 family)